MKRTALLAALALSLATPPLHSFAQQTQPTTTRQSVRKGSAVLRFRDAKGVADRAVLTLSGAGAPAAGTRYVAWLGTASGSEWLRLGDLTLSSRGNAELDYRSPEARTLIHTFTQAVIAEEAIGQNAPVPDPALITFRGAVDAVALPAIDVLVLRGPDTPDPDRPGLARQLEDQAGELKDDGRDARRAADAADRKTVLSLNESLFNRSLGVMDAGYGDYDRDGKIEGAGDTYGIDRYARTILALAEPLAANTSAAEDTRDRAGRMVLSARNMLNWTNQMRSLAATITSATDDAGTARVQRDIAWLARSVNDGQDLNGDGEVNSEDAEGGADELYGDALDLGRVRLRAVR